MMHARGLALLSKTVVGMLIGGVGIYLLGGLLFGWENAARNWWILPVCVATTGIVAAVSQRHRERTRGRSASSYKRR